MRRRLTEERVREIVREETHLPARTLFDLYRNAGLINEDGSLAQGVELARDAKDGSPMFDEQVPVDRHDDVLVVSPAGSAELDHLAEDGGGVASAPAEISSQALPQATCAITIDRNTDSQAGAIRARQRARASFARIVRSTWR